MAVTANTIVSADLAPAISVDFTSRIVKNISELQSVLGVSDLIPLSAGTDVRFYKMTQVNTPAQVAEGEVIPLTEIKRELVGTKSLTLQKYRKVTTAEAIQKVGRDVALNMTDEKLLSGVQSAIKAAFYSSLATGSGTATGSSLQVVLANLWAKLEGYYVDEDVSPIYFINPADVADYLGTASVTMQDVFGFTYIENFLGLGTAVVSPSVTVKSPIATAKENLAGAYAPVSGDVGQSFGLTADATGLVGMSHSVKSDNASLETLLMSGVLFYPEFTDGVFKGTISTGA
ncbi:MAG: hypothetical protein PHY23_10850 [Oscillospiraceae bacterium]|nr:hypothetical protein [Oscillospiraceae bacterium]MDD4511388.1 hypothetical protein [Oscillospiraceae bacterium]